MWVHFHSYFPGFIHGAEVIKETEITFPDQGDTFHWREYGELNKKLEQVTAQSQLNLQQREEKIQELQEEKQHLRQDLDKVLQQRIVTQKGKLTLSLCNF